jgi:hypothetical protein
MHLQPLHPLMTTIRVRFWFRLYKVLLIPTEPEKHPPLVVD